MLFTRIHTYYFPVGTEELKNRLIGRHVNIHNLDFEVLEHDRNLSIIPHAEQVETIKTLPITSVTFKEEGSQTKVVVKSKMRRLDAGGPMLLILFCAFIMAASLLLYTVNREAMLAYTLMGLATSLLTIFCIRLQTGYFDYVRKVRAYVENKANPFAQPGSMQIAA
jgi:hypothetical protein